MGFTIETELDQNGIYSAKHNNKNITTYEQSELDWIEKNPHGALGVLHDSCNINDALIVMSKNLIQNSNQLNHQLQYLENTHDRYWNAQDDYRHIENNEYRKYRNLLDDQNSLLDNIHDSNYPCGLWRYKDDFYYRASPQSELCIGNKEKISKEISSRYPMNVHIVDDLNNIPNNIKEIRFDTVFISTKSIIVIDGEVIEPKEQYEIFKDRDGKFYRNLIVNTKFLNKRFQMIQEALTKGNFLMDRSIYGDIIFNYWGRQRHYALL